MTVGILIKTLSLQCRLVWYEEKRCAEQTLHHLLTVL